LKHEFEMYDMHYASINFVRVHRVGQIKHVSYHRCTNVDPDNLVSEEKEDYWVEFDHGIIDEATVGSLHPFNTMVLLSDLIFF
jgi:hypothetical protein